MSASHKTMPPPPPPPPMAVQHTGHQQPLYLYNQPPTQGHVPSRGLHASDIILVIIATIFPPVAVACMTGCSAAFCINILFTLLGYLPAVIHALYILYKKIKAEERLGAVKYNDDHGFIAQQPSAYGHDGPPPSYGASASNV